MGEVLNFCGINSRGQSFIEEDHITVDSLQALLRAASKDNEIQDDDLIYVTGGVRSPVWITIDRKLRLLHLGAFIKREEFASEAISERLNFVNRKYAYCQFYKDYDWICGAFWLPFGGGLAPRQLIDALTKFSDVFDIAVRNHFC